MNKSKQMEYYHGLRKTNPKLAKTKQGRSFLMKEAVICVSLTPLFMANQMIGYLKCWPFPWPTPTFERGASFPVPDKYKEPILISKIQMNKS